MKRVSMLHVALEYGMVITAMMIIGLPTFLFAVGLTRALGKWLGLPTD